MWISDPVDVRLARADLDVGALVLRPWEAVAFASRLDCGDRTARVGVIRSGDRDVTRLTVDGERHEMSPVVSASGARYEAAGDPATQLWVKGDRATLTLRGATLPECAVVRDAPDAVRARGNEPNWRLELGTALLFVAPDLRIDGTAPPARIADGVREHAGIVNGRSINVSLAPRVCRDNMSGMPFPLTAEVVVSGRTFRGCGGEPETLLIGAEWVVEDIGGTLIDRSRATLDFGADGRLAGRASCNAYTTTYRLTGESLTIGATATTMMNCEPSLMEQERRFLEILQRVRTFDVTDAGALVLRDDLGRGITARRPRP
jgi:heat shock protein HslJ/membrane-bound inhibitor of C-type lysozyme